ncbi:MAG TPA: hypothetical protein VGZ24_02145 [Chthoniobacterales bacterium]|jgi:uncharacterized membrane protein YeaQ/YmgE (transglycosylase-associated protein family)|nr:hypothetical protein [Chthoniobacterales bacterium]
MEWIIFWLFVNAIVGYLIGKQKNEIGSAITVSILLGPIGWLIAALTAGNFRKCPFCAERVKLEALVCKHCSAFWLHSRRR